ncbi:hypothetical protein MRS44_017498 [Fusarium solani]|uniref:uncharacterized protein n=1 Tax=Fusarium solani TaxID=169388 RepID=UPI0032C41605|nr:hypothetical protein MRS44_017498 [Fusarium solani]
MSSFVNSSRASSTVQDGDDHSLTRAESLPIPGHRSSATLETRASEAQNCQRPKQKLPGEPIVTNLESHSERSQDVIGGMKTGNQSSSTPISRINADVSLYMSMRRRSVIQTLGVATRAHHSNHAISAKSSFRNSRPPSPSQTRHNSIESDIVRRVSMPSIQSGVHSPERATTPAEADYRQLGGLKFGSLRITNGTPVTTPVLENDGTTERVPESEVASSREGYFDNQDIPSTLASRGLYEIETREPMATQQPVTTAPSSVAEHTSDTGKSRTCESEMSESGNAGAFPVAEVLDVREDPNAKPSPGQDHLELENKMLKELTRSDSHFIPGSSSESTRQTVSKVDSGYSSNISLGSLRSLRSAVTDKSTMADKVDVDVTGMYSPSHSNSTRTSSLAPSKTHGRLPIHLEVPWPSTNDDVSTCPTSPTSPPTQSFFSFARESRMRLSSLRSSKSIEFRQPKSGPKPAPVPIIVADGHAQQQLSSPPPSAGSGSRLYRFLSGSRKKGLPKVRQIRMIEREVPASPSDAEEGHSSLATGLQSTPSKPPGLRGESSKDTLHILLSVGSGDVYNGTGRPKDEMLGGSKQGVPKKISRRQSWRMSIAAMLGSRSPSTNHSPRDETQPAQAAQKCPAGAIERSTATPTPVRSPRTVSNRMPRHVSKKPASSPGSLASPTDRTVVRPGPRDRRNKSKLAHPRTNSTAPNLSEVRRTPLSPYAEMNSALQTRTSPPVSMPTRSTQSSQGKPQGHSRSMATAYPINSPRPAVSRRLSLPQDLGRSTLQSRQSAPRASALPPGFPSSSVPRSRSSTTLLLQQQQQQQQHRNQRQPPLHAWMPVDAYNLNQQLQQNYILQNQAVVYRMPNTIQQRPDIYATSPAPGYATHRRAGSQGSLYVNNPPFRVLHSYNSPSYRGVLI